MKKVILLAVLIISICTSCTNQYKAERSVNKFLEKNIVGYVSGDFSSVESYRNENNLLHYRITHGYQSNGKMIYHTFTLSEQFNIEIQAFEKID